MGMVTLCQLVTFDSVGQIYRPMMTGDGPGLKKLYCGFYFGLFMLFVSVALMNLVTAVMVEGSIEQAKQDKDAMRLYEAARVGSILPRLREMFDLLDSDG